VRDVCSEGLCRGDPRDSDQATALTSLLISFGRSA
jgi:hypothetical protein